jgi:myo-inositol-1(or 4)-monophosphatase
VSRQQDLERIRIGLEEGRRALAALGGRVRVGHKDGGQLVTDADRAVNEILLRTLPRDGEGWLSEETSDDAGRLGCERVWVVDPLDGTQEFVAGLPEWCISIGLVERGRPVAGGICNPATDELFLGSLEDGVTLNGRAVRVRSRDSLDGAEVLASRSEVKRGEWELPGAPFRIVPMGSVAYKMARVAAGLTDATWTLSPKHEWDVAAGTALVLAAGGTVCKPGGAPPTFNQAHPWLEGLLAVPSGMLGAVQRFI